MNFEKNLEPLKSMGIGITIDIAQKIFSEEWGGYPVRFDKDGSGASVLYSDDPEGQDPIEASFYWSEDLKSWEPECMCYNLF